MLPELWHSFLPKKKKKKKNHSPNFPEHSITTESISSEVAKLLESLRRLDWRGHVKRHPCACHGQLSAWSHHEGWHPSSPIVPWPARQRDLHAASVPSCQEARMMNDQGDHLMAAFLAIFLNWSIVHFRHFRWTAKWGGYPCTYAHTYSYSDSLPL